MIDGHGDLLTEVAASSGRDSVSSAVPTAPILPHLDRNRDRAQRIGGWSQSRPAINFAAEKPIGIERREAHLMAYGFKILMF